MWWSSRNVRSVHLRPVEDTKAHWPASRRQTARWTSRGIWRERTLGFGPSFFLPRRVDRLWSLPGPLGRGGGGFFPPPRLRLFSLFGRTPGGAGENPPRVTP